MQENDLAVHAKMFRRQASTTRAQAARDMKVSQTSIFNAEETFDRSLVKLRIRMIEAYSKSEARYICWKKNNHGFIFVCMDSAIARMAASSFAFCSSVETDDCECLTL